MRQLYRSPNGDTWFLDRDPATASGIVRHQANAPSGGQVTDIDIGTFLSGPINPEQDALLRLIGNSILDLQGAGADHEPSAVNPVREWSEAELKELGNLLLRGLSIEEIARFLSRDHGEVQDKVVEVGRACRGSEGTSAEPAQVFEDRLFPGDWRVEWFDDHGRCEAAIFSGPNARERAIRYANGQYGRFEEVKLPLYP